MLWNDISYELQLQVINKMGDLMLKEKDEFLQFAMAAAMVELEMWSNSPCSSEEPYVAFAIDNYED